MMLLKATLPTLKYSFGRVMFSMFTKTGRTARQRLQAYFVTSCFYSIQLLDFAVHNVFVCKSLHNRGSVNFHTVNCALCVAIPKRRADYCYIFRCRVHQASEGLYCVRKKNHIFIDLNIEIGSTEVLHPLKCSGHWSNAVDYFYREANRLIPQMRHTILEV